MSDPVISPRPVVLVHGAWHGAWCFAALQSELDRRAVPSVAVDLPGHGCSPAPLGGLEDDAAHLSRVLDHLGLNDIVLVGHSYGGAVITHAATGREDLAHLVYVAAFALDDGESVISALRSFPQRDVALSTATVALDDATTTLDPSSAAAALYGECPEATVAAALPRLGAQAVATMTERVAGDPRRSVNSTYVICDRDEAVHPDHQAIMAERCTTTIHIDTDHSPFVSRPSELADVIASAAAR